MGDVVILAEWKRVAQARRLDEMPTEVPKKDLNLRGSHRGPMSLFGLYAGLMSEQLMQGTTLNPIPDEPGGHVS